VLLASLEAEDAFGEPEKLELSEFELLIFGPEKLGPSDPGLVDFGPENLKLSELELFILDDAHSRTELL